MNARRIALHKQSIATRESDESVRMQTQVQSSVRWCSETCEPTVDKHVVFIDE